MKPIEKIPANIIFDFGGVLAHIDVMYAINTFLGMGVGPIDVNDIHPHNSGVFLKYEKGLISTEEFLDGLRNISPDGAGATDEDLIKAWNSIILPYDYNRFAPLLKLRESGHKVFLLSNTNYLHHEYFENLFDRENPFGLKFRDLFDEVYYSDEMHMRKPDREIYETVLAEQNLDAGETIFIDDNLINLKAPKELGMQVYHFDPKDSVSELFGL